MSFERVGPFLHLRVKLSDLTIEDRNKAMQMLLTPFAYEGFSINVDKDTISVVAVPKNADHARNK